jgi:GAF domain-containing protein
VLVVNDTLRDARFKASPFVPWPPLTRFYAAAPILASDGRAFGSLEVLDQKPRAFRSGTRALHPPNASNWGRSVRVAASHVHTTASGAAPRLPCRHAGELGALISFAGMVGKDLEQEKVGDAQPSGSRPRLQQVRAVCMEAAQDSPRQCALAPVPQVLAQQQQQQQQQQPDVDAALTVRSQTVRALSCFLEPVLFCNMAEDRWPILYVNQRFTQAIGAPLTGSSTSAGPCCPCTVTTGPGSDH